MPPIRPSIHQTTRGERRDIPDYIRTLPDERLTLSDPQIKAHIGSYMTNMSAGMRISSERCIRRQMRECLLDPGQDDYGLTVVKILPPDGGLEHDLPIEYIDAFGVQPERIINHMPFWIECPLDHWPWRGCLYHWFFRERHAQAAINALRRAGLETFAALHERIKIRGDWEGVRRIIQDAIK